MPMPPSGAVSVVAAGRTAGGITVWELVPATDSPDPNNQFMLVNVWGALFHPQYAMEANTFLDQNGNRLIAELESPANSAQWYALG
jgi:hypothetical protein